MIPVSSSNVSEVGYDESDQIVFIRYLNGSLYIFKDVPPFEFEELLKAPSIGSHLHRNFRNIYAYERIE